MISKLYPGLIYLAILSVLCVSGCVSVDKPFNQLAEEKIRIVSATPQLYTIQVRDSSVYPVPADGRVILNIPRLERGHASYLLGFIKTCESSPYNVRAIAVKMEKNIVRRLSLNDLAGMPVDAEGYRLIKPK